MNRATRQDSRHPVAVLIIGAGHNQIGIIQKARAMNLIAVAMDGNPDAPGLGEADHAEAANITDPDEIIRVARKYQVNALYPAAEACVIATAVASQALQLPGVTPDAARCMRDKAAMRAALDKAGVDNVRYRTARTIVEAQTAVKNLGLPVIVKPADGNASKGVRQVDAVEDLPLAFNQACARSVSKTVLIEEYVDGEEYNVDGLVHNGRYILGGITTKDRSPLPFRYDMGISMPAPLDAHTEQAIVGMVEAALQAVGFHTGTTHIEVILSANGPRIVETAGRPGGGRIPTDLIPMTYGMDYMADALRIALGEAPSETRQFKRGTAVYWIPTPTGIVTAIEGVDEARYIPGVEDVVINLKIGDTMGHIVDCETRDKVGYVLACADTADEAISIARRARDCCRIITESIRA